MALFAVPLGVAVGRLYRDQEAGRLEREASRVVLEVPDDILTRPRQLHVPRPLTTDVTLGLYDQTGARVAGQGPTHAPEAVDAVRSGKEQENVVEGQLAVVEPVRSDTRSGLAVRAATPYSGVRSRTWRTWGVMAGFAILVLLLAAAAARRAARRLSEPLEQLAQSARQLGDGDFGVRAVHSGLAEVDTASAALEATAGRLGSVLDRERRFTADASHQLRTPLTALRLGLESALLDGQADARDSLSSAVEQVDRLEATVQDLLALARDVRPSRACVDVAAALPAATAPWAKLLADRGRSLGLEMADELPPVGAVESAVRQILDVLLGNAWQHGRGRVTVTARGAGTGVAIEVTDEGPGVVDPQAAFRRRGEGAAGTGIGLALARSLAEAEGGRLLLARAAPQPVFSLVLPPAREQT